MIDPVAKLFQTAHFSYELSRLTDDQIADLLMERIWSDLVAASEESEIVSAAMDRLRRSGGGPVEWEPIRAPE